jgi:hypothetical protein
LPKGGDNPQPPLPKGGDNPQPPLPKGGTPRGQRDAVPLSKGD